MSDLCLNEGILQSYYDGQLAPRVLEQVSRHLASCSTCAEASRRVESEMELTSDAFAAEMALSVPSERLRIRLDDAIREVSSKPLPVKEGVSARLSAWLSNFGSSVSLSPQRMFGFASVVVFFILAVAVGGVLIRQRKSGIGTEIIAGNRGVPGDLVISSSTPGDTGPNGEKRAFASERRRSAPKSYRPRVAGPASKDVVQLAHSQLPGEKNYLKAISVLTEAIETNGEFSLKPTLLADYKRNLEVVNEAIKASQRTARTNPESSDAAEMLYAVYQSKLELLSAIAEQSRPMIAQR